MPRKRTTTAPASKQRVRRKPAVRTRVVHRAAAPFTMPPTSVSSEIIPPATGDAYQIRREKYIALWAGVTFFMVVIVAAWALTIKNHIAALTPDASETELVTQDTWEEGEAYLENVQKALETVQEDVGTVLGERVETEEAKAAAEQYMQRRIELEKFLYQMHGALATSTESDS